jgi:hypothetical protein
MWANTCWGLFGLAFALGLAVLSLPPNYEWLRTWFEGTSAALLAASLLCFSLPVFGFPKGLPQGTQPIASTFISLFGRYRTGWVNVYEKDELGNWVAKTIRAKSQQSKIYRIKTIVPGLRYKVELIPPFENAHVFIKRNPWAEYGAVSFGDFPFV